MGVDLFNIFVFAFVISINLSQKDTKRRIRILSIGLLSLATAIALSFYEDIHVRDMFLLESKNIYADIAVRIFYLSFLAVIFSIVGVYYKRFEDYINNKHPL